MEQSQLQLWRGKERRRMQSAYEGDDRRRNPSKPIEMPAAGRGQADTLQDPATEQDWDARREPRQAQKQ